MGTERAKRRSEKLSEICEVCGEPLDEENVSSCILCGRRFHMAWSIDASVEDCGRIWFYEQACSIGFVCNTCINENPQIKESLIDT